VGDDYNPAGARRKRAPLPLSSEPDSVTGRHPPWRWITGMIVGPIVAAISFLIVPAVYVLTRMALGFRSESDAAFVATFLFMVPVTIGYMLPVVGFFALFMAQLGGGSLCGDIIRSVVFGLVPASLLTAYVNPSMLEIVIAASIIWGVVVGSSHWLAIGKSPSRWF